VVVRRIPQLVADLRETPRTVFHVAGINATCPYDAALMDRINIEGTRSVVVAAAQAGVRRIVYTSSAATIGESAGTVGTEQTLHTGTFLSPYARSKYLAEVAAFREADNWGVDLVSVNPSSVQGPGRATGSAEILIRILGAKRPVLVDANISIVDIEDCTEGHIAAAAHGLPGSRYLLSAEPITVADAVAVASSAIGRHLKPRWVPSGIVRAVGMPLAWAAHMVKPDAGICPSLVRTLLHGHQFDTSKARSELGVVFRPAQDTLGATARWLVDEGYVEGMDA